MARALEAKVEWDFNVRAWVRGLPKGTDFTADDLVETFGTPAEVGINANNAMGAVLNALARQGIIMEVGRRPSTRVTNHGRKIIVWRRI